MNTDLASLFRRITQGVYVIAAAHQGRRDAFTAASLMQVSYKPLSLALAVNPAHRTYPLIESSAAFGVSVLGRDQIALARHFGLQSGADTDKMAGHDWDEAGGPPVLRQAVAWFRCRLVHLRPAGDHSLALAEVIDGRLLKPLMPPLPYADTGNLDGSRALFPRDFG